MTWWTWLLIGWAVVATSGAIWTGAAAAIARRREREARRYQYDDALQQEQQRAG